MAAGKIDELPSNHSSDFAPVIHPTFGAGISALLTAAGIWLCINAVGT
jgi:hippurate hydrolase